MNELKPEKDKFTCPEVEFLLIDLVDALNDAKLIRESGISLTYRHNPQKRGIVVHIMQGLEIEKVVIEI